MIKINDIEYESRSALARAYGVSPSTLTSRLKRNIPLEIAITMGPTRKDSGSKYASYIKNTVEKADPVTAIVEPKVSTEVNKIKPKYYHKGKYECIDILEEVLKDTSGIKAFCLGNCIKYLWRHDHKNGVEDLRKAKWYLEKLISTIDTEISEIIDKDTDL